MRTPTGTGENNGHEKHHENIGSLDNLHEDFLSLLEKKKLTVKASRAILSTSLQPKKIVLDYAEVAHFFDDSSSIEEIKQGIVKVLSNWTNNRN